MFHEKLHTFREKYCEVAYAIFRVVFGLLFMIHGLQKFGVLSGGFAMPTAPLMLAAGIIEVVGGLLLALGLFTTVTAFIAAGEMAVAYFMAHAPNGWLPLTNKGEAAVLFCFGWLLVFFFGPGRYSLDARLCGADSCCEGGCCGGCEDDDHEMQVAEKAPAKRATRKKKR